MKIAVVAPSAVPFVVGGAEKFWWGLLRAFNNYTNHEVELIKLPTKELTFWDLLESYRLFSELDLSHFDAVISTKYPAWMVQHRNHHCYMQHKLRGLYDLYRGEDEQRFLAELPPTFDPLVRLLTEEPRVPEILPKLWDIVFGLRKQEHLEKFFSFPGPLIRALIHFLDDVALNPLSIRSYTAISGRVAEREGYFPPGVTVNILHHPSNLEGLHCRDYDYIFTASRLTDLKRVDRIVKAFRLVKGQIALKIAGTGSEEPLLRDLARGDSRIEFLGFVSDNALVSLYASALFVPFVPYDEDYGLIALEAMQSSKAVVTFTDSGGATELVEDGKNGYCVEPSVEALAEAMQAMVDDRKKTAEMGRYAGKSVSHIRWDRTVERLLEIMDSSSVKPYGLANFKTRPKIVALSTFGIVPPIGGGQRRIFFLCRELSKKAEVTVLSLGRAGEAFAENWVNPSFREIRIPRSPEHRKREEEIESILEAPAEDIAAIDNWSLTPEFVEYSKKLISKADVILLEHPYLFYTIKDGTAAQIWYDAHNVEYDMKRDVFRSGEEKARIFLERVKSVESDCCRRAGVVFTCSESDKNRLAELYGVEKSKFLVVPNGVDTESVVIIGKEDKVLLRKRLGLEKRKCALFVGSWHGPNIEAIEFLKGLARKLPEYLFIVVGSVCCHPLCQESVPDNFILLGVLDEHEKILILNIADVALNPIVSGSGTNLKLLEYLAYKIPVITTPHGNRGLEFRDGKHLLVRELADFESALREMVNDESYKNFKEMAFSGARLVYSLYSWSQCAKPMLQMLESCKV